MTPGISQKPEAVLPEGPHTFLGLYLTHEDELHLTTRCRRALGLKLQFLHGNTALEAMEKVAASEGLPHAPGAWQLYSKKRQRIVALLPLDMPPGEALCLRLGPFYLNALDLPPEDEETPVLRDLAAGELVLLEEMLGDRLELASLEFHRRAKQRDQDRIAQLETMNQIEAKIHGTLELVDVVEIALDLCAQHLGGLAQSLLLLGEEKHELHLRHQDGTIKVHSRLPLELEESCWSCFLDTCTPERATPDPLCGARLGHFPPGSQEAVGCLLGSVKRPLGILLVARETAIEDKDLERLRWITRPVERALKNAILFEKGEQQIAELSLINEMGKALTSSLDLDEVLHYIVDLIASILEADRGSLMLLDRERNELFIEVATGLSERGRRLRLPVGQGIAGYVAASQRPVLSRNTATDKRYQVEVSGPLQTLTLISAPVACRGKLLGVLNFERPLEKNNAFCMDDLEFLSTLASQAGIAIENAALYNDLVQVYFDTIRSLASALEAKDIYTHGHSRRVAKDAVRIARRLDLGKKDLEEIRHGALLHDIGKIGIRDSILFKAGPLDEEERRHIQSHPAVGANIMASFEVLQQVRDIIRYHHERWDGRGFPDGLRGEEIPLGARIVCIADSFDAMITSRPYREGMPIPKALEILRKERGGQFDAKLVDIFLEVIHSIHPALEINPATRG
jgi:putative nucleotidyltransferase with HDIG domain